MHDGMRSVTRQGHRFAAHAYGRRRRRRATTRECTGRCEILHQPDRTKDARVTCTALASRRSSARRGAAGGHGSTKAEQTLAQVLHHPVARGNPFPTLPWAPLSGAGRSWPRQPERDSTRGDMTARRNRSIRPLRCDTWLHTDLLTGVGTALHWKGGGGGGGGWAS